MSATGEMREVFDKCTVMAGVEPDFECVYITKAAAMALLREAEAENARLRLMVGSVLAISHDKTYEWLDKSMSDVFGEGFTEMARELGVEAG